MAGTTTNSTPTGLRGSDLADLRLEFNKLVDNVEVLRAGLNTLATNFNALATQLDSDAGVSGTNFNATHAVTRTTYDAAGDMTAAKVGDLAGGTT